MTAPYTYIGKTALGGGATIPSGMAFSTDGNAMFHVASDTGGIYKSVASSWDTTGMTYNSAVGVGAYSPSPKGISFKDSTNAFLVCDSYFSHHLLSAAWTLSGISNYNRVTINKNGATTVTGGVYSPSGTRIYVTYLSGRVQQYNFSSPWSLIGISWPVYVSVSAPKSVWISTDGLRMYVYSATTNSILRYSLSTPWELSTASSPWTDFDLDAAYEASGLSDITTIAFSPLEDALFVMGTDSSIGTCVYMYECDSPYPPTEFWTNFNGQSEIAG